jgi:hypothetical protein
MAAPPAVRLGRLPESGAVLQYNHKPDPDKPGHPAGAAARPAVLLIAAGKRIVCSRTLRVSCRVKTLPCCRSKKGMPVFSTDLSTRSRADRAQENMNYVRALLKTNQPEFAARLERIERELTCPTGGGPWCVLIRPAPRT